MKPGHGSRQTKFLGFVVLVVIVAWWAYMLKFRHTRPVEEPATQTTQVTPTLAPSSGEDGPEVKFPESARADDPEVNNFIIGFLNALLTDDYKSYRLKVTQRRDPINQQTFDEAYGRVKSIEVKKILKIEDRKQMRELKLEDIQPPIYQVVADVTFRESQVRGQDLPQDSNVREVMLTIFKEQNRWVSSH